MNARPSATTGSAEGSRAWVASMGGPLIAVPAFALSRWGGCTMSGLIKGDAGTPDDYDRACAVNGLAGVIPAGDDAAQALVLADEPAASCYLPEYRAFLLWLAAGSEGELLAGAQRILTDPATAWEGCGTWTTDGPAVLMDSAEAGSDLGTAYPGGGLPEQAPVPLPAGIWAVHAVHTQTDQAWIGLIRLLPGQPT